MASTTLVVINLPRDVDVEALVSRFGAVLRGKSGAAGAQLSPGEVRFIEKPWTVEGVETSVRIAFVDVAGDPRRAAAIMSAVRTGPRRRCCTRSCASPAGGLTWSARARARPPPIASTTGANGTATG